jgi:hypothetical protein
MADKFVHNNPRNPMEERFLKLEEKFVDVSRNMALLMEALASNLEPFEDVGGSNSEIESKGKQG